MISKESVVVAAKIPKEMHERLLKHLEEDTHVSMSEIVREALRLWMKRHGLL
jgi:Arc/MetJ-type ribon-helix-helix transcriptional regulator